MNEKERFIMLCRKNNRLRNQIRASKKLCKKVDKYTKHKNKLLVEKNSSMLCLMSTRNNSVANSQGYKKRKKGAANGCF